MQITLRLQESGLFWIDPLLRLLVLWAGLMGAVAASRDKQHIAIDLFSRFIPGLYNRVLKAFLSLFSSGVCLVLAWFSLRFVRDEATYGGRAILSIPSWLQNSIFPLAFLLMGIAFSSACRRDVRLPPGRPEIPARGTAPFCRADEAGMIAAALGILALFGLPLFVVISALALLAFHSIGVDLSAVIIEMSRLSDTPMLDFAAPVHFHRDSSGREQGA